MKCNCPSGYYFSTSFLDCSPCIANCVKCTGPLTSDCQSCLGELTLSSLGCSCASGMMQNGKCIACYPTCQTCTSQTADTCITCKKGLKLLGKTCVCPNATYFNTAHLNVICAQWAAVPVWMMASLVASLATVVLPWLQKPLQPVSVGMRMQAAVMRTAVSIEICPLVNAANSQIV